MQRNNTRIESKKPFVLTVPSPDYKYIFRNSQRPGGSFTLLCLLISANIVVGLSVLAVCISSLIIRLPRLVFCGFFHGVACVCQYANKYTKRYIFGLTQEALRVCAWTNCFDHHLRNTILTRFVFLFPWLLMIASASTCNAYLACHASKSLSGQKYDGDFLGRLHLGNLLRSGL